MASEKECLECGKTFPVIEMIRGSKTSAYGDKIEKGWICHVCYLKSTQRRSYILVAGAIGFGGIGGFFLLSGFLFANFARGYLEEDFFMIIENYSLLGILFLVMGGFLLFIRWYELRRIKKRLKR